MNETQETTQYICFGCFNGYQMPLKQAERGGIMVNLPHICPRCSMPMQHVGNGFVVPDPKDRAAWSSIVLRIQTGEIH
jgi:hypothetical protein